MSFQIETRAVARIPGCFASDEDGRDTSASSLTRSGMLNTYMKELRRFPLLSREDEHGLAVHFSRTRDPAVRQRLITANLRLVVKLAHQYRRAHRDLLDLVQEGTLGLVQAVEKYDPYRGVKLSSFAAWWIRAFMLKAILNNWRLVKIGTTQGQRKLFFNLRKEWKKLEADGFEATDKQVAQRLSVSEEEVTDMRLRLGQSETSLDAPVGRGTDSRSAIDLLEDSGTQRPDSALEGAELRELLLAKLKEFEQTLVGRERDLFRDRILSEQPLTLQQLGHRYGISRERMRQLEVHTLSRLKAFLTRAFGGIPGEVSGHFS